MSGAPQSDLSRRGVLGASAVLVLAGHAGARTRPAGASGADPFQLVLRPTRVFKTPDHSHEATESWIFSLFVQTTTPAPLSPSAMKIELLRGGKTVRTTAYPAAGFEPLTYRTILPPRLADGSVSPNPIYWPLGVRLRHTEPIALGVDAMRVTIEVADAHGRRGASQITVPIETYQQKTRLIFPFRGKGIILQGGATNGGHRNRSGAFAIDAFGLDESWSTNAPGDGKRHEDYPAWGRPLIAPADGVIVHARRDRPDQPVADESNPEFYAPEFRKQGGGDPGNHLVIDHGAGEFSGIAHFMAGSMLVNTGDRVKQGQVLGKLGQSGDTDGPHCHYQLQAGPDFDNADGLPCAFTNVNQTFLDRGTYFEAK
jgi:murein DD-endopeptidase MepM/ murein hydrolase activator NlpD